MFQVIVSLIAQKLVRKDVKKLNEAQKAADQGDQSKMEEYKERNLVIFIIMMIFCAIFIFIVVNKK